MAADRRFRCRFAATKSANKTAIASRTGSGRGLEGPLGQRGAGGTSVPGTLVREVVWSMIVNGIVCDGPVNTAVGGVSVQNVAAGRVPGHSSVTVPVKTASFATCRL